MRNIRVDFTNLLIISHNLYVTNLLITNLLICHTKKIPLKEALKGS